MPLFVLDPAILDDALRPLGQPPPLSRASRSPTSTRSLGRARLEPRRAPRRHRRRARPARRRMPSTPPRTRAVTPRRASDRLADRFDLPPCIPRRPAVAFDDLKTYRVFTPYFRAWSDVPLRAVEDAPRLARARRRARPAAGRAGGPLARARRPAARRAGGRASTGGSRHGLAALRSRREAATTSPPTTRRASARTSTSAASPRSSASGARRSASEGGEWIRELCWRDFYAQLLHAFPQTSRADLYDRAYARGGAGPAFDAWREGRTGYPLVDAGMRQLAREGWMHNRARLVTASFLVKDLGIDWRARRRVVRGAAARRRRRVEPRQLAVGRRHGCRPHAGRPRCSTRRCRRSAATRVATTSAATCPSSPHLEAAADPRALAGSAGSTATPSRSSTTPRSRARRRRGEQPSLF